MKLRTTRALICILVAMTSASAAVRADVVLEWNEIMLTSLTGQSPVNEGRLAAITQVAVFEAVNAVTRDYQPYLGTIDAPRGASADAAAVAAAHAVLSHYMPERAAELDAAREKSLTSIPDGRGKDAGLVVGIAAAKAMTALRADDGSAPYEVYQPESTEPGAWQTTPGCPEDGGVFLQWRNVTPFGIRSGRQFRAEPPPRLTSWRYAVSYNEVKRVGGADSTQRPQDRADVARFYAAVLSTRVWNPVARQVAIAQGRSLAENARAFALLNIALNDSLIAVFDTKYHEVYWRPETAIRMGDADRNRATRADPEFTPFILTPCHPSYASAHASAAYAARAVLERLYGPTGHFITLSVPAVPGVMLEYRRFDQITSDIDDARVYGGIHFRFDQEAGARMGCRIGEYVYSHKLRRVRDAGGREFAAMDSGHSPVRCSTTSRCGAESRCSNR
jgi:hypothetical protein